MIIGQGVRRGDGVPKVTGEALYVDDIAVVGCLHGVTVRSPHARAKIISIEKSDEYDWSDVTVVTAKDIRGENTIYLMTRDQPALAESEVKHCHEPVALIAADSLEKAQEAASFLQVTYEPLPPLLNAAESRDSDICIFGTDNTFKEITIKKGDFEGVKSGKLIEGTYKTGLHEQLYIEPQGMIAIPREDGGVTITGSMQCPYYIIKGITDLLAIEKSEINVVQTTTGGGFGGKEEYPSMLAAHVALLSQASGKPVKIIYDRTEDLQSTTKRHPTTVTIRSRVSDTGRLLTWEADLLVDGGAYNTLTPVVLSRAVLHVTGPYRCDNYNITGYAVATNTPPNGAFRGFGAPQAQFASERHMDRIARELSIDPVDLRRRNLVVSGDETATGQKLYDPGAHTVLEAALTAADDSEIPTSTARAGDGGKAARISKGRGVALAFHGCGFTGNGEAALQGRVSVSLEGEKVHIQTASTDIGQGVDTIFCQIVAEELNIPLDMVVMDPHDTDNVPDSGPTVASRTTMVVGRVCQRAAKGLLDLLREQSGRDESFTVLAKERQSSTSLRVEEVYTEEIDMVWDEESYQGDAYPTFGWSCVVVDCSVDQDTGEVRYDRFVSATDVGRAINPVLAAGQIEGGSLQALGWATSEEVILDERGSMKNARLTNYIVPTSLDAPEMHTVLVEIPFSAGPFGAKGIGEIPMDAPAAAVAQAIENAVGAVLDELPMTPERVLSEVV